MLLSTSNRAVLQALEAQGWSLEAVMGRLGGEDAPLLEQQAWKAFSKQLLQDIEAVITPVSVPLVREHKDALAWPAGNVGRRFDGRWLSSTLGFFELVGAINRLDRKDFVPYGCGELRLIYRLAYKTQTQSGTEQGSQLPFLLNLVFKVPDQDCQRYARSWEVPDTAENWNQQLQKLELLQLELNAQVVRFPSGVETEFAGQALYLLKIYSFEKEPFSFQPLPLENTPDVTRIQADPALKNRLKDWITQNLGAIQSGVYQLPTEFLATTALSWSTLGINRSANKPFDALFPKGEGLPVPGGYLGTQAGLVERLDNGSCMGCHQAGSMAGFHFLGEDNPTIASPTNRLQLSGSPHFLSDQERRLRYLVAAANGDMPDVFRPHSLSGKHQGKNTPCLVDNTALGGEWGCTDGVCKVVAYDPDSALNFGQCIAKDKAELVAGMSCRSGIIAPSSHVTSGAFNQSAWKDAFKQQQLYDLPEDKNFTTITYNCRPTVLGVPLGRAYRSCTTEERATGGHPESGELCALVGGSRFDACVEQDFHQCLDEIVGRGMVGACDMQHPCREDHVCQEIPADMQSLPEAVRALGSQGTGFCSPTYFLFQLRLDGHPTP
jgi:hypothetical protein